MVSVSIEEKNNRMKHVKFVLFSIGLLALTSSNAQGLLDKISGGSSSSKEFVSLDEQAAKWADGKYGTRLDYSGMWQPQGKMDVKFNKNDQGEVTSIEFGGEKYKSNKSESSPFVSAYYSGQMSLYLTESTIIEYRRSGSSVYLNRCVGSKMGQGAAKKEVAAFREFAEKVVEEEKKAHSDKLAAKREKEAAERKANYGLEDKQVAKIEIINLKTPEKFGHYTSFSFDVVATLKDGSKISTANGNEGYLSDYIISYDTDLVEGGTLKGGFLSKDKIGLTVSLRYDKTLSDTEEIIVTYNSDITNKWNGTSWSRGAGESAMNFKIEVKQVKHTENGSDLLQIRITNVSQGGKLVDEYKIGVDQTMHFFCNGGNGGTDDGRGNNGGNGGNLVVIKDPNVKYFNLDYSNRAGRGGKGANAAYDGRDGRDGTFKEEVRAVKF